MITIGITGANGFIGWHLKCFLTSLADVEFKEADRATFSDAGKLEKFVNETSAIVHLAGVNRASDKEIYDGNVGLAEQLMVACTSNGVCPHILFSSSTQVEEGEGIYAQSKREASAYLKSWAKKNHAKYSELVIPHVFGEYGRPHYNSAVATFCHQISRGDKPSITGNGQLELVHVQDLCEIIYSHIVNEHHGKARIKGHGISVVEVADLIKSFAESYRGGIVPPITEKFARNLFNAYRGAIPDDARIVEGILHTDDRGWLVETVKAGSGGQCFVSSTRPGITRGNHFHRRKFERFFVIKGQASIKLRKLFTDDVIEYQVSADKPSYVDIPTLYTHNITNTGAGDLITLFWSDEIFDPDNPDTYWEEV